MATEVQKKVIIVDVKGSNQAIKDIRLLQKHAAAADKNIARMGKTLGNIGFTIKAFIAYRLTSYVSRIGPAFLDAADSMTAMQSRLELVSDGTSDTATVMEQLFEVADRSRGSIDAVSTLYTRLSASTKDLNVSQKDLLDFTELVSDTFVLSGASAGEAASGVTQLSQAFSKGKLDGDEFKSIMENNVYFGELLAETLGKTRGELLEMSKNGDLTARRLLEMGGAIEEVRKQMDGMTLTSAQAYTAIENTFKRLIGGNNRVAKALASTMDAWSDSVNELIDGLNLLDETNEGVTFRIQQEELRELTAQYKEASKEVGDVAKAFSLAKAGNVDDSYLAVYQGKVAQAAVQVQSLRTQIDDLRDSLGKKPLSGITSSDNSLPSTNTGDTGSSGNKIKSLNDILKDFNKNQQLANQYIDDAVGLFSKGEISLEAYLHVYDKFSDQAGFAKNEATGFADALTNINNTINSGKDDMDIAIEQMDKISLAMAKWPELADDGAAAIDVIMGQLESGGGDNAEKAWIDWNATAETAIKGVTGSFIDMALTGKNSFEDFAQSFLINIAKMIAQQAVLRALQGAPGSGGFLGLFPSAKGNIFNNGNVVPFATGGIIGSPTLFPMANGGTGLAGEAGPEAIMPLKRTASGDLGVKAEGMTGSVIQNFYVQGNNGDAALEDAVRRGAHEGYNMVLQDASRNGSIRRTYRV